MPVKTDDIILERKTARQNNNKKSDTSTGKSSFDIVARKDEKKELLSKEYNRNIRIFAILLGLLSVLILLALVSYTPRDEANTEIRLSDIISLIKGDEAIIAKAQTTQNWLGLVGAVLSHNLFNYTIGYAIILLPLVLGLWTYSLFRNCRVKAELVKKTIIIFFFAILFSGFMGSLTLVQWLPAIQKEWVGAFGYFVSSVLSHFIGTTGTILILVTLSGVSFFIITKINFIQFFKKSWQFLKNLYHKVFSRKKVSEIPEAAASDTGLKQQVKVTDNNKQDEQTEPARIFRRNLEYTTGAFIEPNPPVIINPLSDLKIKRYEDLEKEDLKGNITLINPLKNKNDKIPDKNNKGLKNRSENPEDETTGELPPKIGDFEPTASGFGGSDSSKIDGTEDVSPLPHPKNPLIVTVHEKLPEEPEPISLISTHILDEEISYIPPTLAQLIDDDDKYVVDDEELKTNAKILQEKLETFKIYIENLSVTPGPVVTQYEFVPAAGIKISRIESLADDIAMALKAKGIRIIAPIPGKGTVGIEIPNQKKAIVRFSSIIKSSRFHDINYKLPIALGKTISGEVFCTDLTRMPHLLIAGATGMGKSVGVNTIIMSLLFKIHPKNLKFIFIDPKKVELRQYEQLTNHFLAASPDLNDSIITDPQDAIIILKAVCAEMDLRYDILAAAGQRNVTDYNIKVKEGALKKDKEIAHRPMPYIVVIIDELADLMLTASKEVETPIIRIAQLARAVGIHLVVATQRPSVDVITGIIKANFPARISYQVSSRVDSRTILDIMGAEKLLGDGDMLFQAGGYPHPMRIQNSFISTDEVENICEFIGNQRGYTQPYLLPSLNDNSGLSEIISREDRDPLFEEGARLVIRHQQASVSMIQRRLKVGYARAGRIIDELEATGVIGPYDGSKARTVIMESESELEAVL